MNNFVYTTRRSPGAACIAGRFSIVAVPIVAVPIFGLLSVTVLGRVGGAPAQGWGGDPARRGAGCVWAAPESHQAVLLVLLRMGMALREPASNRRSAVDGFAHLGLSSNKNHVRLGVIYCLPSVIRQPSPGETLEQLALCCGAVVAEIAFQDICYPLLDFPARRGSDGRGAVSASHAC